MYMKTVNAEIDNLYNSNQPTVHLDTAQIHTGALRCVALLLLFFFFFFSFRGGSLKQI